MHARDWFEAPEDYRDYLQAELECAPLGTASPARVDADMIDLLRKEWESVATPPTCAPRVRKLYSIFDL